MTTQDMLGDTVDSAKCSSSRSSRRLVIADTAAVLGLGSSQEVLVQP